MVSEFVDRILSPEIYLHAFYVYGAVRISIASQKKICVIAYHIALTNARNQASVAVSSSRFLFVDTRVVVIILISNLYDELTGYKTKGFLSLPSFLENVVQFLSHYQIQLSSYYTTVTNERICIICAYSASGK